MRLLFSIFVYVLASYGSLFAQTKEELLSKLSKLPDSVKSSVYNLIATKELNTGSIDSATFYAHKAYEVAFYLNQKPELVKSYAITARASKIQGHFGVALKAYIQAIHELNSMGDKKQLAGMYEELAVMYNQWDSHDRAVHYYLTAGKLYEDMSDRENLARMWEMAAYGYLEIHNNDSSLQYFVRLIDYQKKTGSYREAVASLERIAQIHKRANRYTYALKTLKEAAEMNKQLNDHSGTLNCLNELAQMYALTKDTEKAMQTFKEAINLGVGDDKIAYIEVLINAAALDSEMKFPFDAIANLEKGLKIAKQINDKIQIARVQNYLAQVYLAVGDYAKAESLAKSAVQNAQKTGFDEAKMMSYRILTEVYEKQNSFKNALYYNEMYRNVKDTFDANMRNAHLQEEQRRFLVKIYEKDLSILIADEEVRDAKNRELAIEAASREQELLLLNKEKELEQVKAKRLEEQKRKTEENFLLTTQLYAAEVKDKEILELKKNQEIARLAAIQHELEEKERLKTIELLERNNEFLEQDKKRLSQEKEFAKQKEEYQQVILEEERQLRTYFYVIIGSFCIFSSLIVLGLIQNRRKNRKLKEQNENILRQQEELRLKTENLMKANDEINAQKGIIELKNEAIMSSINYAKRIQTAMLPSAQEIYETLESSFVFFRPKDVVSGDFYWFYKTDDHIFLAAVDCTGHGVPGAFMSLIGNNLLHEIVVTREINEPKEILNELHKSVKDSLHKDQTENKDGMEIALVRIDKARKEVIYSGAHHPLLYMQNGELVHIKGEKISIGGTHRNMAENFDQHIISYKDSPLTFYIFTDGYQDQFGGPQNKRFMVANMKKMFVEASTMPLGEQRYFIKKTFLDWKGDEKQIDDVLVMGVHLS